MIKPICLELPFPVKVKLLIELLIVILFALLPAFIMFVLSLLAFIFLPCYCLFHVQQQNILLLYIWLNIVAVLYMS